MALSQDFETLLLQSHEDGVLQVTLNRPDVGNAINTRMGQELLDLWQAPERRCTRRALRGADRRRAKNFLRRRRPEGAQRHDPCAMDTPA